MKHKKSLGRNGSAGLVAVGLLVIAIIAASIVFFNGRSLQQTQSELLTEGYEAFSQDDLSSAYESFVQARNTYASSLSFYRTIVSSESYLQLHELNELIVSTCLAAAHDDFFELRSSDQWVEKAMQALEKVEDPQIRELMSVYVENAAFISNLCDLHQKDETENALRQLFEIDTTLITSDEDFFVFQIRFLIAAARTTQEPMLLNQAREMLFFAVNELEIDNDKTNRLWGILTTG